MIYLLTYLAVFATAFAAAVVTRKQGYFNSFWQALILCFFWPALLIVVLIAAAALLKINERLDRFWTGGEKGNG